MRMRATLAVVTGALALSAFAVPGAQADAPAPGNRLPSAADFAEFPAKTARTTASALPTVSNVTINSGKSVVVGASAVKTFTVSVTASHASGIYSSYFYLWHGSDAENIDGFLGEIDPGTCTAGSATTSTCKFTVTAQPGWDLHANSLAGTWKASVAVISNDGGLYDNEVYKTHKVQRLSKLTVNAAPEPVKKGATLTVTGKLTRADWQTGGYPGLPSGQSVTLQFRKAGTSTYTNVKGIKTASGGALKTTVKASADGYYRFSYAGITSTAASTATGDFVDVK
ncbi:calcium-binding protein [Streptomyces cadmiisoli]|uniref:Calcium-binding protein n=1 Tax=Streptomyces cadmiisoli TaxID=2184053 RepID=A0A2Z4J1A6_9ACTN|nr:calcium-binding protein [Streptomyces cadmiisoli]AWW38965.1 calcium-binding protein [Streptomyces cadmiisoli]